MPRYQPDPDPTSRMRIEGPQYGPNRTLGLEDLGMPGLTWEDQFELARQAVAANPNDPAANANYDRWYDAMEQRARAGPYGGGIQPPGAPVTGSQYGPDNTLGLEDINLPGLSLSDRKYLAGLAAHYNPNDAAAQANWARWANVDVNGPQAAAAAGPGGPAAPTPPPPPWQAPNRPGGYPYGTPTDPNDWRNSWDPLGELTRRDPFWQIHHPGVANEYARNMASQPGGGGLTYEGGGNPALEPGYVAPLNYNPQNAGAVWGQTENWTPPPQGLSPWGAPPPQPAQQATNNPLPAGAPSRARFLRESGVGPRPQAQNLPPQPPGYGTPYEQIYRAQQPAAWAAWDAAAGQRQAHDTAVTNWKGERDRYMPDYRNQLKDWLGKNAPEWQRTTPAPTPPPQPLGGGGGWGAGGAPPPPTGFNPYVIPPGTTDNRRPLY